MSDEELALFRQWLEEQRPKDYEDEDRDIYFNSRGREEILDEVLNKLDEIKEQKNEAKEI